MFNSSPNQAPMTGQAFFGPQRTPVAMTDYGALASHFMTGGQMVHMPQAQYLTSPQYGAFRSAPQTQQFPTMQMNQMSMWQAYLQANQGYLPGLGHFALNVYNPGVDQMRQQVMAQRRLQDMQSSMYGAGLDALPMALAAFTPIGVVGSLAAGLLAPSLAAPYIDRLRTSRDVQNLSMSRIIGGPDMAGSVGHGFSLQASRGVDKRLRELAAGDMYFKEDDYRTILQKGVQSGMFDYASSASQYKNIIERLGKQVKVIAGLLESNDLGEIFDNLERMQRMGAGPNNFNNIASVSALTARMAGISVQEAMTNYGQTGALVFQQHGLTGYQGSMSMMGAVSQLNMAQRMGLLGKGELSRWGGIEVTAQRTTEGAAQLMDDMSSVYLPGMANDDFSKLDTEAVDKFISGQTSALEAFLRSGSKQTDVLDIVRYKGNAANLQQQLGDYLYSEYGDMGHAFLTERIAKEFFPFLTGRGYEEDPVSAMQWAYERQGMAPDIARKMSELFYDPEHRARMAETQATQKQKEAYNERTGQRYQRSVTRTAAVAFKEFTNTVEEWWNQIIGGKTYIDKDIEESQKVDSVFRHPGVFGGRVDITEDLPIIFDVTHPSSGLPYDELEERARREVLRGSTNRERYENFKLIQTGKNIQGTEQHKNLTQALSAVGLHGVTMSGFASKFSKHTDFTDHNIRWRLVDQLESVTNPETGRRYTKREAQEMASNLLGNGFTKTAVLSSIPTYNESAYNDVNAEYHSQTSQIQNRITRGYEENFSEVRENFLDMGIKSTDVAEMRALSSKDSMAIGFVAAGSVMYGANSGKSENASRELEAALKQIATDFGLDFDELKNAVFEGGPEGFRAYIKNYINTSNAQGLTTNLIEEDIDQILNISERSRTGQGKSRLRTSAYTAARAAQSAGGFSMQLAEGHYNSFFKEVRSDFRVDMLRQMTPDDLKAKLKELTNSFGDNANSPIGKFLEVAQRAIGNDGALDKRKLNAGLLQSYDERRGPQGVPTEHLELQKVTYQQLQTVFGENTKVLKLLVSILTHQGGWTPIKHTGVEY